MTTAKQLINEKLTVGEVVFDKSAKTFVKVLNTDTKYLLGMNGEKTDEENVAGVTVVEPILNSEFQLNDRFISYSSELFHIDKEVLKDSYGNPITVGSKVYYKGELYSVDFNLFDGRLVIDGACGQAYLSEVYHECIVVDDSASEDEPIEHREIGPIEVEHQPTALIAADDVPGSLILMIQKEDVNIAILLDDDEVGFGYVHANDEGYLSNCFQTRFSKEEMFDTEDAFADLLSRSKCYGDAYDTLDEAVREVINFWVISQMFPISMYNPDLNQKDAIEIGALLGCNFVVY